MFSVTHSILGPDIKIIMPNTTICPYGSVYEFTFCMLLLFSADIFQKLFQEHYQCQRVWILIGAEHSVGPDLGPNYLQWLSADDKSRPKQGKSLRYFNHDNAII